MMESIQLLQIHHTETVPNSPARIPIPSATLRS